MRKIYLLSLVFLITIFMQALFASPFSISYTYVNTDSQTEYLNIQYGNFYDNVNLRLRLQATDGYTSIPVIVSPKVYGISDDGQLTYLYSIPTQTYYAYSTPYDYTFSNIFYLNPNYQGYAVKVYAQSVGYVYNTYSYAYVYPVNTAPYYYFVDDSSSHDQDNTYTHITDCSDFFLSGSHDIYLDEDEEKTYNLYIENEANDDLEILDVETSNPSKLDIDDIDYPDEVPDLSVRTARVYLEADSVNDDYDSDFDITVTAKYPNTSVCTKTYNVEYHIDDKDNDNDSSCSDLVIKNTSFTINDDSTSTRTITLENNSDDYDFEIDDITIDDRSGLSATIEDEPDEVQSEDTESVIIELEADDFDSTITKYLPLEVTGKFVRDNHDDKECTKKVNLTVRIEDDGDNSYNDDYDNTSCNNIQLYTMNISQAENTTRRYTRDDGFYVVNNSNETFTITNVSVNDNSNYASTSNTTYTQTITPRANGSINFDLITSNVNTTQTSRGTLLVSGRFSSGKTCSSSQIGTKYFDISVYEPSENSCSGIEVSSTSVSSGNNQVSIHNRTNKKFYVNDVLFQNKQGLNANVNNSQITIPANSNSSMTVGISGTGSLEMLVSGKFEDGRQCGFTETKSGLLSLGTQANLSSACNFQIIAPTAIDIKNSQETINLVFRNNTSKNGRIEITGNGLLATPGIIFLSGFDNFTQNINLSNFNNPTSIYYTVLLNDCPSSRTFTNVVNSISDSDRITLVSYPTMISPVSSYADIAISINNRFTTSKTVTAKLSGFPNTFVTQPKTITLSSHETKETSLVLSIPDSASKIEYNGYIELYLENKLVNKYPLTINLSPATQAISITSKSEKSIVQDRVYNVTLTLKNNTSQIQEATLDFGLPETYVIEGDKDLIILPNEEITKHYKIVAPTLLKEETTTNIKIIDKATGKELSSQTLSLKSGASPISGFFTLANTSFIILGIVIIVVLVIIFRKK